MILTVGTLLTALIRQGDLTTIIPKICAYFIMQDLFQDGAQNMETPFTPVLLHTGESMIIVSKVNLIEKRFVTQLLSAGTKDVSFYFVQIIMYSFKKESFSFDFCFS